MLMGEMSQEIADANQEKTAEKAGDRTAHN